MAVSNYHHQQQPYGYMSMGQQPQFYPAPNPGYYDAPPPCCYMSPPMPQQQQQPHQHQQQMRMPPPPLMPPHQQPLQQQQLQQTAGQLPVQPRRLDLGYESEDKESDRGSDAHSVLLSSRPASPCDSARPDSPEAASDGDATQLAEDLAGFRVSGPRPVDMALSQKMEMVWHERFIDFFSRFAFGSWHLYPVFDPPDVDNTGIPRNQWRYCKDQAKVRFICTSCQKAWTSMGGQVVFWIYKDDSTNTGYIHFKLYGQKCTDCNSQYYEHAIWYQEEVEKVIENLYYQVGHMYYGMPAQRKRVDRRLGHPKREHNSDTCQACRDRVCRMGQLQKRKTRAECRRDASGSGSS